MKDQTNSYTKRDVDKASTVALVASLTLSAIVVSAVGHRHFITTKWTLSSILALWNYVALFAAEAIALAAAIRWAVTRFRQKRHPAGIACIAGAILAIDLGARELASLWFLGFSPDSLLRSVTAFAFLIIANIMLFPDAYGEKEPEKKNVEVAKPSLSSIFGALTLVPLSLLFLTWNFGGFVSEQMAAKDNASKKAEETVLIPYPARHSDIAKAFVSLCAKDRSAPGGCGFFVGSYENGKRRVMLVTAAHVAASCFMSGATNDLSVIVNHGNGKPDFNIKLRETGIGWGFKKNGSDIAAMDVTPYFDGLVKNGWDVKYIPALQVPKEFGDEYAVTGTFILSHDMYEKYNVGIGTPIVAYGNAYELWSLPGASSRQPLGLRSGIIAAKPDMISADGLKMKSPIVIECDIFGGYSGGPVFANAQIGAYTYPALLGITSASLTTQSLPEESRRERGLWAGFALVTPADELQSTNNTQPQQSNDAQQH